MNIPEPLSENLHEFKGNFQLLPGQYAVITGNAADLQKQLYTASIRPPSLKTDEELNLPDDEGTIALVQNLATLIDCFFL